MDVIKRAENCLDTYALVAISLDDKNYRDALKKPFVVPDLALAEFYDVMARKHNTQTADYWQKRLWLFSVPVPRALLIEAVRMRRAKKELNLSLTDAAGYCLAQHLGLPFVTGDKAFKGMKGVDYRSARV